MTSLMFAPKLILPTPQSFHTLLISFQDCTILISVPTMTLRFRYYTLSIMFVFNFESIYLKISLNSVAHCGTFFISTWFYIFDFVMTNSLDTILICGSATLCIIVMSSPPWSSLLGFSIVISTRNMPTGEYHYSQSATPKF